MKILIDIGNTNIAIKSTKNSELFYIETKTNESVKYYHSELNRLDIFRSKDIIDAIIVSSSVNVLNDVIKKVLINITGITPYFIHDYDIFSFLRKSDEISDLSDDIICDCVAITHKYGPNSILIDLGTLTKIMVIDGNGVVIGGAVLPGVHMLYSSLTGDCNKTFHPYLSKTFIGSNIFDTINIGIVNGTKEAIIGLTNKIENELGKTMKKIITGGFSNLISDISEFIYDKHLLFDGLLMIEEHFKK